MNEILRLLREVRMEMLKSVVLESFLDATLIFLGAFLVMRLLNFFPYLAITIGLGALAFLIMKRMKAFRLKAVEDRNPIIKDMLRTVADNANRDNFVLRALNSELLTKMRNVASSSFITLNKVVYKIMGIVIMSFLIVYISATHLMLLDLGKLLQGNPAGVSEGSVEDIYGEKTELPKIGNKQIDIKLNPLSYEINIDKIEEAKPKQFKSDFPLEVYAAQEKSYEENIPKDQQIIIKNYFASVKNT